MDLIPQRGSDFCNQSIFNLVVDFLGEEEERILS